MSETNQKRNKIICIFLALVIIFTLAIPVFGAEAFLSIEKGAGDSMSDTFIQVKEAKLNGRIYSTSEHGAYFSVMKEIEGTNNYTDNGTKFRNYSDTDSKTDEEGRYLPVIVKSNVNTDGKSVAMRSRINPYRVYNDVKAKAKLTKTL